MAKTATVETLRGNELGRISAYNEFLEQEKIPVVGRDGSYHWVLPKSGGKMVPATKAQILKLRKGFTEV